MVDARDRQQHPDSDPADALGSALVAAGVLTEELLAEVVAEVARSGRTFAQVLKEMARVSESDIAVAVATRLGHRYVDLNEYEVDVQAVALITETMARRYQALPIGWDRDRLVVAMINPTDLFTIDDLRIITGAELELMVTTPSSLDAAFGKYYRPDAATSQVATDAMQPAVRGGETEDAPIVRLVQVLIAQALADRASDIHIEPGPSDVRVRYRVDGVLHEMKRLPREMLAPIVSRVKIMAELDIAERRLPQDGRVSATFGRTSADLRVSTLPTVLGEQVTIRMLDTAKALLSLDDLGFLPDVAERYETAFRRPYGAILATGPTGSGKTTTLYATLNALNIESTKIVTVEDPVEYQLPGISQIQVNGKAGLTFARALRSILRSDPDVILVGEIRDSETAFTAVDAALTGHLVFSTLHTQDAASTPARLIEMGVEGHLVGSALDAIVAQRLTRRLCEKCRRPVPPTPNEKKMLAWAGLDPPQFLMQPVGCSACASTGYSGRLALHEVMLVSEEIERMIAVAAASDAIRKVAVAQGMLTFRNVGLTHVQTGVTSLEEILRVVV